MLCELEGVHITQIQRLSRPPPLYDGECREGVVGIFYIAYEAVFSIPPCSQHYTRCSTILIHITLTSSGHCVCETFS